MKISVVTPILNEIRFIEGWYENVKKFADEIIVVDTGSTDGSLEFLCGHPEVFVYRWPEIYKPYHWPEHEIRNWTLRNASGDWIVMLDADDLVGNDFIENLNSLDSAKWLIGRFVYLQFWMDYGHLRKRKLWPLTNLHPDYRFFKKFTPNRKGKRRIGYLNNWRGWYPNKNPKICKRDDRINYAPTGNHCILQYKNYGHLSYHLPWITKDFDIGVFHSHFINFDQFGKVDGNRERERNLKSVSLVKYTGDLPDEIKYYTHVKE